MKGWGIFFVICAVGNLIIALFAMNQAPKVAGSGLRSALMFGILGWVLINKANKNKQKQEEKEKWNNNEEI